jgi:hypothetical protein
VEIATKSHHHPIQFVTAMSAVILIFRLPANKKPKYCMELAENVLMRAPVSPYAVKAEKELKDATTQNQ